MMSETVIFFREEGFYPIALSGRSPIEQEVAAHANLNPGTLWVEDLDGRVLWTKDARDDH